QPSFFFSTAPPPTAFYPLSLHDALPICIAMAEIARGADLVVMATHGRTGLRRAVLGSVAGKVLTTGSVPVLLVSPTASVTTEHRSEEHTSELQSRENLVCRLLLEKKKKK